MLTRNLAYGARIESTGDTPVQPGQFIEGGGSHDLPDDAGRLVFDEYEPTLYLPVDAAS